MSKEQEQVIETESSTPSLKLIETNELSPQKCISLSKKGEPQTPGFG
jgi:hypothetical protein